MPVCLDDTTYWHLLNAHENDTPEVWLGKFPATNYPFYTRYRNATLMWVTLMVDEGIPDQDIRTILTAASQIERKTDAGTSYFVRNTADGTTVQLLPENWVDELVWTDGFIPPKMADRWLARHTAVTVPALTTTP
jgi:hypothetical protein